MSLWQQENEIHTIGLPVECVLSNPVKKAYIYLKKLSLNKKKIFKVFYLDHIIGCVLYITIPPQEGMDKNDRFSSSILIFVWIISSHAGYLYTRKWKQNCKIEKDGTWFSFTHNGVYQFFA